MAKDKIVLAELDVDTKKLVKSMQDTAQEIEKLSEKQEKLKNNGKETSAEFLLNENTLKRLNETYKTQTVAIQAQTDADGKLLSHKKAVKDAVQEINKSENEYLQNNERLLALKKNLDSTDKDYEKSLARINGKLQENNNWLKENGSAFTKVITTMNDYKQQAIDSFNSINILNGGFSGLVSRAQEAGGVGPLVKGAFEGMSAGIGGMAKAIMANPLGAFLAVIQLAVGAVIDVFKQFAPVVNKVEQVMAAVGAVFESVRNSVLGLLTGATSLGDFFSGFIGSASGAAKEAMKLKDAQQQLEKQTALQEIANEKAKNSIDALMEKSKDQTKTDKERLEFLRQAQAEEQKNFNEKKRLADDAYNNAVGMFAKGKNLTNEELKQLRLKGFEYAQHLAERKIIDKEELESLRIAHVQKIKMIGDERKMASEHAAALKEMQDDSLARQAERDADAVQQQEAKFQKQQEILDKAAKKQKLDLDLFISQQGTKAKSLQEELQIAETIASRKRAIAKREFDAENHAAKTKIDRQMAQIAYDTKLNDINKGLMQDRAKATTTFADATLKKELDKNQAILDNDKFLNDELYKQKQQALNDNLAAEKKFYKDKLKAGAIGQQAYDDAISKIEADNKAAKQTLDDQKAQADNEKKLIDIENQKIAAASDFEAKVEMERQQNEILKQQELAAAETTGADKAIIIAKYAKIDKDLTKSVEDYKWGLRAQMAGMAKGLFKEHTLAYKALAIGEATINTYLGATKALADYTYPVGPIFAGLTIAQGVATVAKIAGVKLEKGGLVSIGGRRHSEGGTKFVGEDGTRFEAEQGELIGVMNRNAARHFMAFNNAFPAGGTSSPNYFAGGGIVSREMASPSINTDELASKIAEANRALPAPVVAVQDIVTEGNSYIQVRDMANF